MLAENRPQLVSPLDDDRVVLFPETAEFYGEEIRVNPDNFCIAWWSKAADYVAWQVKLSIAGEYEVWLEWAIADDLAGNAFVVRAGDAKLTGKIDKTGGWTSFKRANLGVVKLPAGEGRLELHATNELKGELADVRSVTLNPVGAPPPPGAPDVPAKSPADSLNSIRVHPAMQVELVAAEPLIRDPIAIAWGPDLKLWVVEMGDYPLGADGKGSPGGRIKFLEDIDKDGRYDKETVFLDNLGFPTGVLPWRKGVLVTCAPDIFYAEDTNGDGRADLRQPLVTGFPERNQQHRVNGLRLGIDNWVHCANGDGGVGGDSKIASVLTGKQLTLGSRDLRFRPDTGEIEPQSGPTQFGRNQDDWGNWFGSNNAQPFYHFALDEHYLLRNSRLSPPDPRVYLFSVGGPFYAIAPSIAFHGEPQSLTGKPRGVGMSSACSGMIYRDELLGPEFAGNAFVCDPVTNLIHRRWLSPKESSFTSERAPDESENEFFASADPWTRPIMVQAGPDGSLYVVDMYRLYIEHPQWINAPVLQRADLRAGSDRGRIYRISPRNGKPRVADRLDTMGVPQLVSALDSPSGWQRDIVQQLLFERQDRAAVPLLIKVLTQAKRPQSRLQALASLAGLSAIDENMLRLAIRDSHAAVRRLGVQLAEPHLDKLPELASSVVALVEDIDRHVVLQVAYSLGEWNDPQAGTRLGQIIADHRDDQYLVAAALSSAVKQPAPLLAAVIGADSAADEALLSRVAEACAISGDKAIEQVIVEQIGTAHGPGGDRRQFALLATLLDTTALSDVSRTRLTEKSQPLFDQARKLVANESVQPEIRASAVRVLARQKEDLAPDIEILAQLLSSTVPLTLAEAAVDRLAKLDEPSIGRTLAARLNELSPSLRSRVFDAILARNEWTLALLDELGRNERLAASIDAARQQRLLTHASTEVRTGTERIFGTVKQIDRQAIVAEYATAASTAGDIERGRAIFKTHCSACHRLEGTGNEVGPNLLGLKDKSPQILIEAILNPSRAVEDKFIAYNAATTDGRVFSGLIQSESGNSITITAADGRSQAILRSQLETLASTGRSLMPDGFEKTISPSAMSDLLTYLAHVAIEAPPGNGPR